MVCPVFCCIALFIVLCTVQFGAVLYSSMLGCVAFQYLVVGCIFHFVIILYHMKSKSTLFCAFSDH